MILVIITQDIFSSVGTESGKSLCHRSMKDDGDTLQQIVRYALQRDRKKLLWYQCPISPMINSLNFVYLKSNSKKDKKGGTFLNTQICNT